MLPGAVLGIWSTPHSRNVQAKRKERCSRITALSEYQKPLTSNEEEIWSLPVSDVANEVNSGNLTPLEVLRTYGKRALTAQSRTNCVTEILIDSAEQLAATPKKGPLAGVPVSLKDNIAVKGYDSTVGYSKYSFKPLAEDAPCVRLLKDAGALPFVKTNIPMTLLSFESYNDVWGVTENPHVKGYTSGGSSGGESALIAAGGSRIGVGSDVAGSVRVPAHFAGIYSIKCTVSRFPKAGSPGSTPGQEGVPSVQSPMARTLPDLTYFLKSVIDMKPWKYDYAVTEMPWKPATLPQKLKVGIMWTDGITDPSPACSRALRLAVDALKADGHKIVDFSAPNTLEALNVGAQLLCSDGVETATSGMWFGERNDAGVARIHWYAHLPWVFRWIWYAWVKYWRHDEIWATLVRDFHKLTINERWALVYRREAYRQLFFDNWNKSEVDFVLTVPNATPALPHQGLFNSISSCLYTFLFNIVDYPAGIVPVTKVDEKADALPKDFDMSKINGVSQGAYLNYDATKMHGLPVGVQLVGRRFHEEDVLAAMALLEEALHKSGTVYQQIP